MTHFCSEVLLPTRVRLFHHPAALAPPLHSCRQNSVLEFHPYSLLWKLSREVIESFVCYLFLFPINDFLDLASIHTLKEIIKQSRKWQRLGFKLGNYHLELIIPQKASPHHHILHFGNFETNWIWHNDQLSLTKWPCLFLSYFFMIFNLFS